MAKQKQNAARRLKCHVDGSDKNSFQFLPSAVYTSQQSNIQQSRNQKHADFEVVHFSIDLSYGGVTQLKVAAGELCSDFDYDVVVAERRTLRAARDFSQVSALDICP